MRLKTTFHAFIVLIFFIVTFSLQAYASSGTTVDNSPIPGPLYGDGATNTVTFWELPLWIQITSVVSVLIGLIAMVKLLPFILGKIKNVLDNNIRNQIYTHIKENPGSTTRDIVRQQGLNLGTVKYHIHQLQASYKITIMRSGKFLRIFQNSGKYTEREKVILSVLKYPSDRQIIQYLEKYPDATNLEVAQHLEITEGGAHKHLAGLVDKNIVSYKRDGKSKKYYLNDDVKDIFNKHDKP